MVRWLFSLACVLQLASAADASQRFISGATTKQESARQAELFAELMEPQQEAFTGNMSFNTPGDRSFHFLLKQFYDGYPHSYQVPPNYWRSADYLTPGNHPTPLDSRLAVQDRVYTDYGLNLYDGATWEIALALLGQLELPEVYERGVLYLSSTDGGADLADPNVQPPPQTNGLQNIRADTPEFLYGASQTPGSALPAVEFPCGSWNQTLCAELQPVMKPGASFFRLISNSYIAEDVYVGQFNFDWRVPTYDAPEWNKWGVVVWNDWKPITGENVWAAIIGPVQYLIIKNQTLSDNSTNLHWETWEDVPSQIKLALTIVPALQALQSVEGALYHCPKGSQIFPEDEDEATNVSNENNFSAYAAIRMLLWAIREFSAAEIPQLSSAANILEQLMSGLERWFQNYALGELNDGVKVFYQGGHVPFGGGFEPADLDTDDQGFAVDCQTWGSLVLGPKVVDDIGGAGTAFGLWNATKTRAGYFHPDGSLGGVGFAGNGSRHDIWSTEWTYGAIFAVREMVKYYNETNPEYVLPLLEDISSMERSLVRYVFEGGMQQAEGGFLYANTRYFIPWGWFANPVGSLCGTSWHVFNRFHFNPFVPGGGLLELSNWPPSAPSSKSYERTN